MKRILIAAAVAAATIAAPPLFAADVGVSVSIGQPGFYGRLDIGDYPQPQVIYRQPVLIDRIAVSREPVYLRVPPGHAKHWRKHCREYNACGQQVYFVQDDWYNRQYAPRYREQHGDRGDGRRDEHRDDHRGEHDNDRHGDDHGRGDEHGHGHGRDH